MASDQILQVAWTHAIQIAIVVLLALALTSVLRKRTRLCWAIWLVVLLKCVTPPVLSHQVSLFSWTSGMGTAIAGWWQPADDTVGVVAVIVPEDTLFIAANGIEFDATVASSDLRPANLTPQRLSESIPDVSSSTRPNASSWILTILVGCSLFSFALMFLRYVRCHAQLRRFECRDFDERTQRLLAEVCEELSVRNRPRIMVTKTRFGPAVIGVFRPLIVLPHLLVEQLDDETLRPVIAHELVHIRRGDLFVGWLQAVAHCLWWFHPCVWLANRAISAITELCCDQQVLAETNCGARQYARSLLAVIECRSRLIPVPIFPGMKPVEITQRRLEKIMTLKHGGSGRSNFVAIIAVMALSALVLPTGTQGQTAENGVSKQKQKSPDSTPVAQTNVDPREADVVPAASATLSWKTLDLPEGPISKELVVASVDGTEITAGEVAGAAIDTVRNSEKFTPEQQRKVIVTQLRRGIDRFIEQQVILSAAEREYPADRLEQTRQILDQTFEDQVLAKLRRDKAVESNSELDQVLAQEGLSIEKFKEAFLRAQTVSAYLSSRTNEARTVQEMEISAFYKDNLPKYTTPERIHCQEIEIKWTNLAEKAAAKEQIQKIVGQCKAGADFGELATRHSDALRSKADGEMGWLVRGDLVDKELDDVLWSTSVGTMTDVIERDDRVSIYRITEHQKERVAPLHEVHAQIEETLRRQQLDAARIALVNDLKAKAVVARIDFGEEPVVVHRKPKLSPAPRLLWPSRNVGTPLRAGSSPGYVKNNLFAVGHSSPLREIVKPDLTSQEMKSQKTQSPRPGQTSARTKMEYRIYRIADLVIPLTNSPVSHQTESSNSDESAPQGTVEPGPKQSELVRGEAAKLIELIRTTVSPDSWEAGGGTMIFDAHTLSTVVSATPVIHEQIVDLLHSLRKHKDRQVSVSIRTLATRVDRAQTWNHNLKMTEVQPGLSWAMATSKQMQQIEERLKDNSNAIESGSDTSQSKAGKHYFEAGTVKITTFDGQQVKKTINASGNPVADLTYSARRQSRDDLLQLVLQLNPRSSTDTKADTRSLSTILSTGTTLILKYQPSVTVGVPMLDKIPKVKQLFINRSRVTNGEDLYIFLTPQVLHLTEAEFKQ